LTIRILLLLLHAGSWLLSDVAVPLCVSLAHLGRFGWGTIEPLQIAGVGLID
jgi:hypothetical protein